MRACALDFKKSWDEHVSLVEFSYNNSFHSSIGMAPYEALYRRKCHTPLTWCEVSERLITGPDQIQKTVDKIRLIQARMKAAQDRQKSYADQKKRHNEYEVGEHVLSKFHRLGV